MAEQSLLDLTLRIGAQVADLQNGINKVNGELDGFKGKVASVGKFLAGAFSAAAIIGAGKAVADFALEIGQLTDDVNDLTGAIGEDLVNQTARAKAIADSFGADFTATLNTAQAVSKNLGGSVFDAMDIVQKGLAGAGTHSEEFLSILEKVAPTFSEVGISASELAVLINTNLVEGFGENGVQAIKKATFNLRNLNDQQVYALHTIGVNGDELRKGLADGSVTMGQAIQQVISRISALGVNSAEAGAVIKDIFGKTGLEAGQRFFDVMSDINLSLDDQIDAASEISKAQLRLSAANENLNKTWVELFGNANHGMLNLKAGLFEIAGKALVAIKDGVIDIANYFIDLYNNSMIFRSAIQGIVFVFKQAWEAVKLFWNILVEAFSTVGKLISAVLKGDFSEIKAIVGDAFTSMAESAIVYGKNTATNFIEGAQATLNSKPIELISKATADKAINDATQIAGQIANTVSGAATALPDHNKSALPKPQDRIAGGANLGVDLKIDPTPIITATQYVQTLDDKIKQVTLSQQLQAEAMQANMAAVTPIVDQAWQSVEQGASVWESLGKTIKAQIKGIIKAFIAQGIAGVVSRTLGTVGGPWGVALAAASGALAAALFNSIVPGFAGGTNSAPGGLSLVGEMGPELVNLPKGSRVHTNDDTRRMLSGASYPNDLRLTASVKGTELVFLIDETNRRK